MQTAYFKPTLLYPTMQGRGKGKGKGRKQKAKEKSGRKAT
jgi:hypothetical protein